MHPLTTLEKHKERLQKIKIVDLFPHVPLRPMRDLAWANEKILASHNDELTKPSCYYRSHNYMKYKPHSSTP